ncbi:hypothetical protein PCASD_10918 [Puccinia coronata f. sp. avenae]|uniref:Uncharacterized protein n=1 Tax=Puccinia coronata f. sp. avenae TaxID=200324 RepID=A0A2N5TUI9_9BASI|nr:hypothetical protein PCASD_10918 [Puccinia coronata f. sp. avenae]
MLLKRTWYKSLGLAAGGASANLAQNIPRPPGARRPRRSYTEPDFPLGCPQVRMARTLISPPHLTDPPSKY